MTQLPSRHLRTTCIKCKHPMEIGEVECTHCNASKAGHRFTSNESDPFHQHLNAERKRKITIVLGTIFAAWYVLLLIKPIFAQRPDVELAFTCIAPIAIGLWLWSKPVSQVFSELEVRLPAEDLHPTLIGGLPQREFDIGITREYDFISAKFKRNHRGTSGTLTMHLQQSEEFTKLAWSLHFDGRVKSDDAHYAQSVVSDSLQTILSGWL